MTRTSVVLLASALLVLPAIGRAQTYSPIVSMTITLPDGSTQDVSVRESGVATFKAKDGTEYQVRPTVHDEPFTTAMVALFKAPTSSDAGSLIAEVSVKKGGAAVTTKSQPAFKVAIKNIELKQ